MMQRSSSVWKIELSVAFLIKAAVPCVGHFNSLPKPLFACLLHENDLLISAVPCNRATCPCHRDLSLSAS